MSLPHDGDMSTTTATSPIPATAAAAMRGRRIVIRWLPTAVQSISVAVANNANVTLPIP